MKRIPFFATKGDLETVMRAFEASAVVDYYSTEPGFTENLEKFVTFEDIPNVGIASYESSVNGDDYLLALRDATVDSRAVAQFSGGVRYFVDQLINPCTIRLSFGGLWGKDVLLSGLASTVHDDPEAQMLMRAFSKAIRKNGRKIGRYWVGPEAERFFRGGMRLTDSAQSPPQFDLSDGAKQ